MPNSLAQKRSRMIREFLNRWFLLGGFISSDTYKRTMWSADDEIARMDAAYHLTFRRGLQETGANDRLIMAGHEWLLRQWFAKPLRRRDIELAIEWYTKHSAVKVIPVALFNDLLNMQKGEDIYLPIDVWGFPGGQTFLAKVPSMTFEGPGGIVSFIEPQMCRYFGPVIHATKGRLMFEAAGARHAEFGYRSDGSEIAAIAKLLSIYVGNGGNTVLTSNDAAEFMFPEIFKAIGTIGHEFMSALQDLDKDLDEAERESMDIFVTAHGNGLLLCDLIDAETVGLENAIWVIKKHPDKTAVGIRVDSGDIKEQCVLYFLRMRKEGIKGQIAIRIEGRDESTRTIVFENEVTPDMVREVLGYFFKQTRIQPIMLFPGAGGYYYKDWHRDTVSAAFKRSKTENRPNTKFSNSPGKESIPGRVRVYSRDDVLVVADASESIDGEPLYVKLVDQGRIVNPEDMDFKAQAERANRTWNQYKSFEFSPLISEWMECFRQMRREAQERALKK